MFGGLQELFSYEHKIVLRCAGVRSKDDFRQLFNIAASVGIKPGEIPMSSPQMTSMFGFFSALIISLGFVDILSQVAYWPSWLCQHVDA
jgi:hypothetical protein